MAQVIGITAAPTTLIEDQGTLTTLTFTLRSLNRRLRVGWLSISPAT